MSRRFKLRPRSRPAIVRVGAFALAALWAWLAAYQNYLSVHLLAEPHHDGAAPIAAAPVPVDADSLGDPAYRARIVRQLRESARRHQADHDLGLPHSHGPADLAGHHPHDRAPAGSGGHGHSHGDRHAPHAAADHLAVAALLGIEPGAPPSLASPAPAAPPLSPALRLIVQELPRANPKRGPPASA